MTKKKFSVVLETGSDVTAETLQEAVNAAIHEGVGINDDEGSGLNVTNIVSVIELTD